MSTTFKICKPYKKYKPEHISQGYHSGHKALDLVWKYGTYLVALEDSVVVAMTTPTTLDGSTEGLENGWGIRLQSMVQTSHVAYLHWHCLPIFPVKVGDFVKQGQIVAQMGNSGFVKVGGNVVPLDYRFLPHKPGTHDHFVMEINGKKIDPRPYIDLTTSVGYGIWDIITAIKVIIAKIKNLLK